MTQILETVFWGNTVTRWLIGAGIAALVYLGLILVARFGVRSLAGLAARTKTELDDIVADVLAKTHSWILLLVSIYAGSLALDLPVRARTVIGRAAFVALVIQVGLWLSAALDSAISRYRRRTMEEEPGSATTATAVGFLGKLVIWALVLLLALENLGIDVTALIAGLGIGGIAVALAAQSILGDLFSSLSIFVDKPFVIGDYVTVGDFRGTVESVGLKTTRLRSLTGEQLVFTNSDLLSSRIHNFGRMQERRAAFTIGVTYDTPREVLEKIPGLLKELIEAEEQTRFDRAHFKEFGAYSLNVEAVYWVLSPDYALYLDIQQRINLEIYRRFEAEGIEFAYPTQVVLLQNGGDGETPAGG